MENAMPWKTLDDMDLAGKTVLVRVDINVPMEGGPGHGHDPDRQDQADGR
jgi:3-phosphoglycerate kinase